jgi:rubrerythrin
MTPVHPDILMALTAGIQSEIAAYVFYVEAAKSNEAGKAKEVLERLALEEKEHFQVLERQYDSLVRSEKWISTADLLKQEGLPEITEEMSQGHKNLIDEVAQADSLAKILDIAYRLEKEAFELFDNQVGLTDSKEGKNIFARLAGFERGHMELVEKMREDYL